MAIQDPQRIYDGTADVSGGMDAGTGADTIALNQVAKAVNVTCRGGRLMNRPSFDYVTLHFESSEDKALFETGAFQGASTFYSPSDTVIVASVGGELFRLRFTQADDVAITRITPADGPNSSTIRQVVMEQAEDVLVIQDGVSSAIVFNGVEAVRSDPNQQGIPIGSVMAYGLGRLWVSDGRNIFASDVYGSSDGAVTRFSENIYLAEGGAFRFPPSLGTLRALVFPPTQDTSSGQGELLALGDFGGQTIFASLPRDEWKNTVIERVTLRNPGPTGPAAFAAVNGDIWYRAADGLRSYRMSRARWEGWGSTARSSEVGLWLDQSNHALLYHTRMAAFDGRLLTTVLPGFTANRGAAGRGLAVIDFDNVSSLADRGGGPCFDGLWTGVNPTEIVVGRINGSERCFIFSHNDGDGKNKMYELKRTVSGYDNNDTPITSFVETRAYQFDTPFNEKKLVGADIWLSKLGGEVTFDFKYRPDAYPCWTNWATLTECAALDTCNPSTSRRACLSLLTAQEQHRSRLSLPTPGDTDADPITHELLTRGCAFQLRMEWTGPAQIARMRTHALSISERTSNIN